MERFRRIVVDNATYQWLFRYHGHDYHKKPYLLIVKEAVPDKSLKIEFSITDHFLLNSGLPAVFQSNQTVINLNRPKLISQIIRYCLDHEDEIPWDKYKPLNGISILKKMGFEIPPIFLD